MNDVTFLEEDSFIDQRGSMKFVNEFSLTSVKRFYKINPKPFLVRAWQGHKKETKFFYVNEGSFIISWVKIIDFENPDSKLQAEFKIISADQSGILTIPGGFANGFKALEPNSNLIIYSDFTLEDSNMDRWSFDSSLWFNWDKF